LARKIVPDDQARERMVQALKESKRRFDVQNKKVAMLGFEHEARFALQALANNPSLYKCDPETLKDAMANLAAMGLSLNPASQQVALIPRWNSKKGSNDVTACPMYRGLMKLATDTGLITNITAEVVFECEEDSFDVDLGSNPYLTHKPRFFADPADRVVDLNDSANNKMVGSYCIAEFKNSEKPHITLMDLTEVLAIAKASDAFNPRKEGRAPSGPWLNWPAEMVKKAVIRRATKQWPLSDDAKYQQLLTAVHIDNEAEANEQHTKVREDEVEADMGEPLTEEQVETIKDLCSTQDLSTEAIYRNYATNSLSKIKMKFFGEIHEKLLDRQRRWNEAKAKPTQEAVEDGVAT